MYPSHKNQEILKNKFKKIKDINNTQDRGYQFEELIFNMLRFYGFESKRDRGKTKSGDQIDIITNFEGRQLIIETKYKKKPIGLDAINNLNSKLEIRPPNTIGIIFSMSGYTEEAENRVSDIIKRNILILIDSFEIEDLLENQTLNFEELLKRKIFFQSKDSKVALNIPDENIKIGLSTEDSFNLITKGKKTDWLSTESRGMDCVLFSPIYYGYSDINYLIKIEGIGRNFNDLLFILKKYEDIFGFTEKTAYCISQVNHSWLGLGVSSFLNCLENMNNRYKKVKNLQTHHTEAIVLIDEISLLNGEIFTLSFQRSIKTNDFNHLSISFLLENIPFPGSRFELFFKKLSLNPEYIQMINYKVEKELYFKEPVKVKNIGYLKFIDNSLSKDLRDNWTSGIICDNPFYNTGFQDEIENVDMEYSKIYHIFKTIKKFIMFFSIYDHIDSNLDNYFKKITYINIPSSGFRTICLYPLGERNSIHEQI